jgi:hypothetical protein
MGKATVVYINLDRRVVGNGEKDFFKSEYLPARLKVLRREKVMQPPR